MNNRFPTLPLVISLLCGLALSASAQVIPAGGGYLLRTKYSPGQTIKFRADTAMGAAAQQGMAMVLPFSMSIKAVKNGIATIDYSIGPMSMNGKTQGQQQTMTAQLDNRNKLVDGSAKGMQFGSVGFPEKPVKIGQSWTGDVSGLGRMGPGMTAKGTYTLKGVRRVGGKQVAEIGVKLNVSGGQGFSATGSGSFFVMTSDGSLHSASLTQNISMGAQRGQAPMSTSIKIVRL